MRLFYTLVGWATLSMGLLAHDVVWPGNPQPLVFQFSGEPQLVRVQPVTGEPCIVEVNLEPLNSTLVSAEFVGGNTAVEVLIRITVLRAPTDGLETVLLRGEWHATDFPPDQGCTASSPFSVPIEVQGSEPELMIDGISPMSGRPGQEIVINGMGFDDVTQISFGGTQAQFTIVNDSTIHAIVPQTAPIGAVTLFTPMNTFESESLFVIQPELKITVTADEKVLVSWDDRSYPFTLQTSTGLGSGPWTDILTTFDTNITLSTETAGFYRLIWNEIPLDRTDYNRDRPAVAAFYHQDPVAYWAEFGIPALARLSIIRQNLMIDPYAPFEGFMQGYDEGRFLTALETQILPMPFASLASNYLSSGSVASNAFVNSMITLVQASDAGTNCATPFRTNCFSTNTAIFVGVMTNTMNVTKWTNSAPQTNKTFFNPSQFTNNPPIRWVDVHGSDAFTTNPRPVVPPNDDTNTTFKIRWEDITTASLWNTTYDAACVAVAVGASLAKLGVVPAETTCRFWNELSKLVGATPGTLGAYEEDIAAFYKSLGYSCSAAYDGPLESAVEEAKKALDRGCDVQIEYINAEDTRAHEEVVLGITIDPANASNATISTLSWGTNATVNYTGSASGGSYSGKSDGTKYRKSTETSSYLEGKGTAIVRYYCKE